MTRWRLWGMCWVVFGLALCGVACEPGEPPGTTPPATCPSDPSLTPPCPSTPPAPKTVKGCDGAVFLEKPADPAKRGPWAVGAKTLSLPYQTEDGDDASLGVEVWYPAALGSEQGKEKIRYDIRLQLPEKEQGKISDQDNPWQACDCYRDLPIDEQRGPYPVMLFIHGTAGFRTQSLQHMVHWASRGFIVVAADHPGIKLGDALGLNFAPRQDKDAKILLEAIRALSGPFAFLKPIADTKRLALSGHSAGGNALSGLGSEPGVQVLIPMAAGGVKTEPPVNKGLVTLVLGGADDQVVPYTRQQEGYASSPSPKALVGLEKAGHLAFSDLCVLGKEKGGLINIAIDSGVEIPAIFKGLIDKLATDGCQEGQLDAQKGWDPIHYASSAVLESVLHCDAAMGETLSKIQSVYPQVSEFKSEGW